MRVKERRKTTIKLHQKTLTHSALSPFREAVTIHNPNIHIPKSKIPNLNEQDPFNIVLVLSLSLSLSLFFPTNQPTNQLIISITFL